MQTMQTKFLKEIAAVIKSHGLEPVQQESYSNVGLVFAQSEFRTFFTLRYQFNTGDCSLHFHGDSVDELMAAEELADAPPKHRVQPRRGGTDSYDLSFHVLDYADHDRVVHAFSLLKKLAECAGRHVPAVPKKRKAAP